MPNVASVQCFVGDGERDHQVSVANPNLATLIDHLIVLAAIALNAAGAWLVLR